MNVRAAPLIFLCLVLAVLAVLPWGYAIGTRLYGEIQPDAGLDDDTVVERVQLPTLLMPARLQDYSQTVSRPLFVASRRPSSTLNAPVTAQPGQKLLLERYPVVGVVVAGERRIVLIRTGQSDKVVRLQQGEMLDGWSITEIAHGRIVLEKAGAEEIFLLHGKRE
ncbi:MAG TPA: hypothetical protein DDW95_05440 [Alphaproteobacteria bacterium]|nr:hypothetical protein [Alphaproteobacteria bacterium]